MREQYQWQHFHQSYLVEKNVILFFSNWWHGCHQWTITYEILVSSDNVSKKKLTNGILDFKSIYTTKTKNEICDTKQSQILWPSFDNNKSLSKSLKCAESAIKIKIWIKFFCKQNYYIDIFLVPIFCLSSRPFFLVFFFILMGRFFSGQKLSQFTQK